MLSWYVAIQDDYSILDTAESGNQDLFFKLYRDLETPNLSSSGKPNVYVKISYVFPSTVRVNGLGVFSDALFGQCKWTDSQVLRERNIVLGNDRAAAQKFFLKWRTTVAEVAISAF